MTLRERWRFFHKWAGWCEPPSKAVCAMDLARAEEWAEDEEVEFEWAEDECVNSSEFSDEQPPYRLWVCLARLEDETVSLGGIDFGRDKDPWMGDTYKRVVEAELAMELQTDFFTV